MSSKVIVLGDSHIGCMSRLRNELGDGFAGAFASDFVLCSLSNGAIARELSYDLADGGWVRNAVVTMHLGHAGIVNLNNGAFRHALPDVKLYFLVGSVESHTLGFDPEMCDFGFKAGDAARTLLPTALIIQTIKHRLRSMTRVLKQLTDLGLDVAILGGPAPHKDIEMVGKRRNRTDLPDAQTRLEIYRCNMTALAEIAASANARFIDSSPWLADEEGFLCEAFLNDGVHANGAGGKAWLAGLDRALSVRDVALERV